MNWSKASAVAEILASIAVLVTLVYLTIEVGQNTAALQTSARQATVQSDVDILLSRVQFAALGLYGFRDELSPEESVQFNSYLFAGWSTKLVH